jgi:hypothetical protein
MNKLIAKIKRWWHDWIVADAAESKSYDEREQAAMERLRREVAEQRKRGDH